MPLGFVIHNGIGPFTASFYSASNNTQIGSTQDIPTPDSSGSFTFNAPVTAGSYTYYIKGVDEETNNGGSGAAYDFQSQNAIYTISPALKAPTISISSNALDQGQPLEANVVVTGGTEPYSATVDVYSASSNALVYHNDVS
ncbi:40-residue YVTN family beta-propeller repeat protein, partial [mine drainage metagenome]